jgi:3,4-dihydroxy 2-butanone 4-phosphate synthase
LDKSDVLYVLSMTTYLFITKSGYICAAVPPERLDELEIPLMIENNTEKHKTAYTHTVDYKAGQPNLRRSPLAVSDEGLSSNQVFLPVFRPTIAH